MRALGLIGGWAAGLLIGCGLLLWWVGRRPKRPPTLPANAIYIETGVVPFKLRSTPGKWLGCWYDPTDQADHCKITDENGKLEYEDIFLPYKGQAPIPQNALIFDSQRTGNLWTGSYEKGIRVPVIYLTDGQILLPKTDFEEIKRKTQFWVDGSSQ
jgi:hypothetical protein